MTSFFQSCESGRVAAFFGGVAVVPSNLIDLVPPPPSVEPPTIGPSATVVVAIAIEVPDVAVALSAF